MRQVKHLIGHLFFLGCFSVYAQSSIYADGADDEKFTKEILKAVSDFNKGNYSESIPVLKKASDQRIFLATEYLGQAWEEGRAFPQNYDMAFKYYNCAAQNGYYPGMYKVAYFYSEGLSVKQSYQQSYFWLILSIPGYSGPQQKAFLDLRELISKRLTAEQINAAQIKAKS